MVIENRKRDGVGKAGVALVTTLAFLAAPLVLAAQETPVARLAEVSITSSGIDFFAQVDHGGAILRVSGAGSDHVYTFGPGESPSLSAFDAAGEPLADGTYTWELQFLPLPEARADLMKAAAENEGRAPGALPRQSGAFTVAGGYLAEPDLVEPTRAPALRRGENVEPHHDEIAGRVTADREQLDDDAAVAAGLAELPAAPATEPTTPGRPSAIDADGNAAESTDNQ